jgi:DNA-binding SARP family transcriptional activator
MTAQVIGDRASAREALAELAAVDPPAAFASALGRMLEAQLALDEEDVDGAEESLVAARLEAERMGNPMVRAMVLLVTSRVRRARGDPASARGWIEEANEVVVRGGVATLDGWVQLERARVLWALGEDDGADASLQETISVADERSAAHIAAEASVLLAALSTRRGCPDAGVRWIEAARRVRAGGYGFLLERDRAIVAPQLAHLARQRTDSAERNAGQELLSQLARTAPAPIRVIGLGRFEVSQGRRVLSGDELRKRRAGELFRFLLLQRRRAAPRDVVIDALWPEHPVDRAAALFHQATSTLRRVLEPDLPDKFPSRYVRLAGDEIELVLPTGSSVDFERFESLAGQARREARRSIAALSEALEIYGGELFPSDRYLEWTASRRSSLAMLAAATGVALCEELLGAGDARAALDASLVAIERDPLYEDAVEVGMRAALVLGDRIGAVRMYRECERRLAAELDVAPSAALRELADAISG